ncbi:unnamed protein product [Discula destructiva]
MYSSLVFSFLLLPLLALAVPTAETGAARSTDSAPVSRSGSYIIPKRDDSSNTTVKTNVFDTVNYFPDPVVHCSGRLLSDSGDTDYSSSLDTAVITTSDDGLYGACNVGGTSVDGYGTLAWKSGKVQVYYCNHAFAATDCDVNEYWRADALIDDGCGKDGGGWVTISDWSLTIGRDPTNSGGSFRSECGDSLHGVSENFVILNTTLSS